jgi:hypothetical protein
MSVLPDDMEAMMIQTFTVLARTPRSFYCEIVTGLSEFSARQAFLRAHPGYEILSLTEIQ